MEPSRKKPKTMQDQDKEEVLEPGVILQNRFRIAKVIGKGGFGLIYEAYDISKKQSIAIKTETKSGLGKISMLHIETLVLSRIHKEKENVTIGFPRYYHFGRISPQDKDKDEKEARKMLAMDLLGPSLDELHFMFNHTFSLSTILLILDQLLDRLELLHGEGILHRDLKLANILIGKKGSGREGILHLIDFGLAYVRTTSQNLLKVKEDDEESMGLFGTYAFMSIRAHQELKQGKKDDLESLVYVIASLIRGGNLPWEKQTRKAEEEGDIDKINRITMDLKMKMTMTKLFEGVPWEFSWFADEVRGLKVGEEPEYQKYKKVFRGLGGLLEVDYDGKTKFDWDGLDTDLLREDMIIPFVMK